MTHAHLFTAILLATGLTAAHAADEKWWVTSSPNAIPNGSITLRNASGIPRTMAANPTGANLSTRTAATQPPTVVVQATASLPIKAVGDACTSSTTGTAPNQAAGEGTAITSDRSSLLTCQSSHWVKQGGSQFTASSSGPEFANRRTVCVFTSNDTCHFYTIGQLPMMEIRYVRAYTATGAEIYSESMCNLNGGVGFNFSTAQQDCYKQNYGYFTVEPTGLKVAPAFQGAVPVWYYWY